MPVRDDSKRYSDKLVGNDKWTKQTSFHWQEKIVQDLFLFLFCRGNVKVLHSIYRMFSIFKDQKRLLAESCLFQLQTRRNHAQQWLADTSLQKTATNACWARNKGPPICSFLCKRRELIYVGLPERCEYYLFLCMYAMQSKSCLQSWNSVKAQ